jgi:hypothetical protein
MSSRRRRFPSRREIRALNIGADELMNIASWVFRKDPSALKNLRREYRSFCSSLLRKIERGACG